MSWKTELVGRSDENCTADLVVQTCNLHTSRGEYAGSTRTVRSYQYLISHTLQLSFFFVEWNRLPNSMCDIHFTFPFSISLSSHISWSPSLSYPLSQPFSPSVYLVLDLSLSLSLSLSKFQFCPSSSPFPILSQSYWLQMVETVRYPSCDTSTASREGCIRAASAEYIDGSRNAVPYLFQRDTIHSTVWPLDWCVRNIRKSWAASTSTSIFFTFTTNFCARECAYHLQQQ